MKLDEVAARDLLALLSMQFCLHPMFLLRTASHPLLQLSLCVTLLMHHGEMWELFLYYTSMALIQLMHGLFHHAV